MKKIMKSFKGFVKSIFGGAIFVFVKLFSIVRFQKQTSKAYIKLDRKPDDEDGEPTGPPPPPYKTEKV